MRSILISWVWFSLIISISFNANFYRVLTTPRYGHRIQTVIEAAQTSHFRFGYPSIFSPIVSRISPTFADRMIRNHIDCSFSFKCLNESVKYRDLVVAKSNSLTKYRIPKYYLDEDGTSLIYSLPSPLFSYNVNMIMVKGFPVLTRFNELLMRMNSNGMISRWVKDYSRESMKQARINRNKTGGEGMDLEKSFLAFIVWSTGCIAALLVFLIEISYNKVVQCIKWRILCYYNKNRFEFLPARDT